MQPMSLQALRLLTALKKSAQGGPGCTETRPDGAVWQEVCPGEVTVRGITPAQKAGYLSALQHAGVYQKTDTDFGMVKLRAIPRATTTHEEEGQP